MTGASPTLPPGTRQGSPSGKRRRAAETGGNLGLARLWHAVQFHVALAGNDFATANAGNIGNALLLEDALKPTDGIALAVEKAANAFQQVEIGGAIIAPAAGPLHGLDLGESGFPKISGHAGEHRVPLQLR